MSYGRAFAGMFALACAGCAPSAHVIQPQPLESTRWSHAADDLPDSEMAAPANLAALLQSSDLAALTAAALKNNPDIAIASARIERSSALLGEARLAALPSLSASAGASQKLGLGGGAIDFRSAFASLHILIDIDPFGRIGGAKSAALARSRAADIQRELIQLAVETNVARVWVTRAALARRIQILDQAIGRAGELERVVHARYDAGAATRVDVGQQSIRVNNMRRDRSQLLEALDKTRTALATLCGAEAPKFEASPADIASFALPRLIPPAPGTLLAARPDVRASEALIAAANGDVRAARAAFYPSLSFSSQGLLAWATGGLLTTSVTLGASVLAPIFDRGRLNSNLRVAAADQVVAVEQYRQTVLNALTEVEDITTTIGAARDRALLIHQIVKEARLTARLARTQYIEGEEGLWTEIDAEQLLGDAESAEVLSLEERLLAQIALYQAMGGHREPLAARRLGIGRASVYRALASGT